jgi:hypothetical protein
MHLWNIGLFQQDYMAVYPRRLSSLRLLRKADFVFLQKFQNLQAHKKFIYTSNALRLQTFK